MKKIYFLIFSVSLCLATSNGFSQVLFENNNGSGDLYNSGLGTGGKPIIVFDDINIPGSRVMGADSIGVTMVKVGIGRVPSASAVTVKIYITTIDPLATTYFDSLPAVPPVYLTSVDLPAGGPSELLSVGDSIHPFFTFKTDTGRVFEGYQTIFVGVSFSATENPFNNGWIFSAGPDGSSDIAFEFDSLNATTPRYTINFGAGPTNSNPEASFYTEVYGKTVFSSPTPVTLKDFMVTKKDHQNMVTWKTETEINSSFFKVERSKDGTNFESIGQVSAAGNSNLPLSYQFVDIAPDKGINYYRLRTVDKNNSVQLSMIRNVTNDAVTALNVYPNPVTSVVKADINSEVPDKGVITITDIAGRQVYSRHIQVVPGNNTIDMDIRNLAPGSYAVKIKLSDNMIVKKITKQ